MSEHYHHMHVIAASESLKMYSSQLSTLVTLQQTNSTIPISYVENIPPPCESVRMRSTVFLAKAKSMHGARDARARVSVNFLPAWRTRGARARV